MGNKVSNQASSHADCISPRDRARRIEEAVQILHRHLSQDAPIALPPDLRWAIAEEARHCWTKCKVCVSSSSFRGLHEPTCAGKHGRRGGELFEEITNAGHSFSDKLSFKITGQSSWPRVRNIVHAIVHHQSRLDAKWYKSTIHSLDRHTSLIPRRFQGTRRDNLVATLFAEILAVTVAAHMLHVSLRCLGRKDTAEALSQLSRTSFSHLQPTYNDIVSEGMLKRKKSFRRNECIVHTPYVLAKDFDRESTSWQELDPALQEYVGAMMFPFHPLVGLSITPRSLFLVASLASEISLSDWELYESPKTLDPARFCCNAFSWNDFATLAETTSRIYGTSCCRDIRPAGAFPETTSRQLLLVVLVKVLASKALVDRNLDEIMKRLRREQGEATAVEAAGSASWVEAYSKVADATGRKTIPKTAAIFRTRMRSLRKRQASFTRTVRYS